MPETYTPKHLNRWKLPPSYFGARWDGWYVAPCTTHRDAGTLERSNWKCQLALIPPAVFDVPGADDDTPASPCVVTENHWAVGYVEWYAIHESDADSLRAADALAERLEGYPVVDEDHLCTEEEEEANEIWRNCFNLRERIALCAENGVSIFAARHDCYPADDTGAIRDSLLSSPRR